MSLVFSLFVCLVFLITAGIVAIIGLLIIETGVVQRAGGMAPIVMILSVLLSSVLVGTIVSFAIGHIPLRPMHKVIAMTKELASGNFDVRLTIDRPPEFRVLAESFNSMARELGSIEMLRTDFVNNFSHEFKTPIVSIKGFAELLKHGDLTEEERNEYLDIVISESSRLAALSTSVLYLSKIENQEILTEKEPVALAEQIRHTILLLRPGWEKKGIDMTIDLAELTLDGNEEMLEQAWLNLIDNAIKYTPEGGRIRISLAAEGEQAVFTVRDSGCGIEADSLPRIFDRFYQADTSHAAGGNGLGLTLVGKVVALHKGTVHCDSAPGEGTTFAVRLPLP